MTKLTALLYTPTAFTAVTTVYIKNGDDHANIEKTPEDGGYWGIVFEGPQTAKTEDDFKEGIVYGNGKTVDLSERTEPYVLGAGKKLTVLSNVTFKPSNEFELNGASDTEKSILYLKTGANLEYWYEMTKNEYGEIQHEDRSTYGWYYADEEELYNGSELIDPDLWDEVSHLYINDDTDREGIVLCNICGKLEPHNYDPAGDWQQSETHHWHLGECDLGTDCSIDANAVKVCSYTSDGKLDNGKHIYDFTKLAKVENGKWYFECKVCEYEKGIAIPAIQLNKVDGEGAPLTGAEFGLYSDAACTDKLATAESKGAAAVVSFDGDYILPNTTYYIKETQAPDGYTASNKVFAAKAALVNEEGKVTYGDVGTEITSTTVPECKNIAEAVASDPAKLIKIDGEGKPLVGAEFGIYSDAACKTLISTATTATDTDKASDTYNKAVVIFDTARGETYYIKETKAPDGYKLSDKIFKVTVDANGKVTYGDNGSEELPICENIANVPDEPDPEEPNDPKPVDPKPNNPTPNNPTPDEPTPDEPKPDDNDNPNTGVGFGIAGLMLLGGSLCVASVTKRRRK